MITHDDLDTIFTWHAPQDGQPARYRAIRDAGKHLADIILESTPPSADQTAAIRKVREAVMTANVAITLE